MVTNIHLISKNCDIWFAWLDVTEAPRSRFSLSSLQQLGSTFNELDCAQSHRLVRDVCLIRCRNGVLLQSSFTSCLLIGRILVQFQLGTSTSCIHHCTQGSLLLEPLVLFHHRCRSSLRGQALQLVRFQASSCPTREYAHPWKLKRTQFQSYQRTRRHHRRDHGAISQGLLSQLV